MKTYLYNKRRVLMQCEMENGKVIKILEVYDQEHMPVILTYNLTVKSVNQWLDKRSIPDKREGYVAARMAFPRFDNNRNMFSLSDQYWFRCTKKDSWDDLNFFTNDYQTETGKIFFTPWAVDREKLNLPSPDLTTGGALIKTWIKEGDVSALYKAGSVLYHQEPLSEVLASDMLAKLGIVPYVRYTLAVHGLKICSRCTNFVTEDTEFVPAYHIYNFKNRRLEETHYDHFISMCKEFGIDQSEARHFMTAMIAADVVTCNHDRHLGNFGLIRDVETAKFIGFAPLFDFGDAYRGTKAAIRNNHSRLFEEKDDWAVKQALKHADKDKLTDTRNMQGLIDNYPGISDEQRKLIVRQVNSIEKIMKTKDLDEIMV